MKKVAVKRKAAEVAKKEELETKPQVIEVKEEVKVEPHFEVVEETEPVIEEKIEESKADKSLLREIIRFVVVGVAATLIDFIVELVVVYCLGFTHWQEQFSWGSYLIWAIAVVVGFLASTVINYLLSYIWVFKNVDKKKVKRSASSFILFTFLSAVGLLLGIGLQLAGNYIALEYFNIDLGDLTTGIITNLGQGYTTALAFIIIFVIKTFITMVYNFVSRKLFIFKKPKEEN